MQQLVPKSRASRSACDLSGDPDPESRCLRFIGVLLAAGDVRSADSLVTDPMVDCVGSGGFLLAFWEGSLWA